MIDVTQIKIAAAGRWKDLLPRLTGIPVELLDGKNHPCPKCGGNDRFRMIDEKDGALFCNQCFSNGNGDGLAAIMWLAGKSFPEAVALLAGDLGIGVERPDVDVIQEMAWRKGITAESLRAYGAESATRGKLAVCRVPMFDGAGEHAGFFDLAPSPEEFSKGKMTPGSKHGLFITSLPKRGDEVLIVEGVKDAAALHALGFSAVGLPTCRMNASFAEAFRGADVIIVPDRDKAGTDGANETAGRLYAIAASVRVATLPAEYRETGGEDLRDVLRKRDGERKLREAIERAPYWTPAGSGQAVKLYSLAIALNEYIDSIGRESKLIPLGLPGVDEALAGGVLPGEMIIIAGRPSHGKSACMLQAIHHLSHYGPCLILSEEMSVSAIAQRFILSATGIPESEWFERKQDLCSDVARFVAESHNVYIAETCGTATRAVEAIRTAKNEHGIVAVAVDYVQMLDGSGSSRYEKVSQVSTQLKRAAVTFDVVLLALCQLNRQTEARNPGFRKGKAGGDEKEHTSSPRMSDLRDSGQLEQDADVILFVEWPRRTSPQGHVESEYRIYVAKNRNRRIVNSIVRCVFIPERQRLYFPAKSWHEQSAPAQQPLAEFEDFA